MKLLDKLEGVVTVRTHEEFKIRLLEEETQFNFRDSVSCHVGQDNWVPGVIMAKDLYLTPSARAKKGMPYDSERCESNYEAYQVSAGHTGYFAETMRVFNW